MTMLYLHGNNAAESGNYNSVTATFILYEKGIPGQLKRVANRYGLEVIFTRSLSLKSKLPTKPFKSCSTCGEQ